MTDGRVTLYDPHPGLAGCPVRLPGSLRVVCKWLDGVTVPLSYAVETIRDSTGGLPGEWDVRATDEAVLVTQSLPDGTTHCWRAIRYRQP